jgi:hypothetical protein
MEERSRQRLTFGAGLDRATGTGLLDPQSFRDLRNVDLGDGRAIARKGFTARTQLSLAGLGVTAMTDVPFIQSFRAFALGLAVGYEDASRTLQIFTLATTGLNPTFIDDWGTLAADAGRPRVFGAESYRKFFLAHDHADLTKRLATCYFDGSTVATLQANLDGGGNADVKFRGVVSHLNYLLGWGYGTAADPDRPEVVRVSLPGQPTVLEPEHYWLVGSPAEAVLNVVPLAEFAMAMKGTQLYRLEGYSRATFRSVPADTRYGLAGARLAAVANGLLYFWSLEGPRVTNGGPSEDLAIPLELDGPEPDELVESGEIEDGFAVYRQERRVVEFHFGRRCYELHLKDPRRPRWSYRENGVELRAAGTLYAGTATSTAPTGHPELGVATLTTSTISFDVTHSGALGDEVLEVWLKVGAGAWTRVRNATIQNLVSESVELTSDDGLEPATLCEWAVRYRRGLTYTVGYTSTTPSDWPAVSYDTDTTATGAGTPSGFTLTGSSQDVFGDKTYNSFDFAWTAGSPGSTTEILIADEDDPDVADPVAEFSIAFETRSGVGSYLQSPTPRLRYFFIRHKMADGTPGTAVACAENPVNVAEEIGEP